MIATLTLKGIQQKLHVYDSHFDTFKCFEVHFLSLYKLLLSSFTSDLNELFPFRFQHILLWWLKSRLMIRRRLSLKSMKTCWKAVKKNLPRQHVAPSNQNQLFFFCTICCFISFWIFTCMYTYTYICCRLTVEKKIETCCRISFESFEEKKITLCWCQFFGQAFCFSVVHNI